MDSEGVFLLWLLSLTHGQQTSRLQDCPASCVVCSNEAVICQRLASIIDVPVSTQALMLTEGSISSVDALSLSELHNVTLLDLSQNHISSLSGLSFRNLSQLHTLLLDHNRLSLVALQGGALAQLPSLELLSLGHNLLTTIQGRWLAGTRTLRSLKLEGNLVVRLDPSSFPPSDLVNLETLDLSDNLIENLDPNSFRGLVSLRELDLSRNRLSSAPPDAFSYLSWLSNLNVDLNTWNCTCQLLELSAFLHSYMLQPDKVLYNGQRLVCVNADNPAVTTVLELTEANCVPANQNITLLVAAEHAVTPQRYGRDLAIAATICFSGGVGVTLVFVLIVYHRLARRRKNSRISEPQDNEEKTLAVHAINQWNVGVDDKLRLTNHIQPWDTTQATLDSRDSSHFKCPDCSVAEPRGGGGGGGGRGGLRGLNTHTHTQGQGHRMERGRTIPEENIEKSRAEEDERRRAYGNIEDWWSQTSAQGLHYQIPALKRHSAAPANESRLKAELVTNRKDSVVLTNRSHMANYQPETTRLAGHQSESVMWTGPGYHTAICENCHVIYNPRRTDRQLGYSPRPTDRPVGYDPKQIDRPLGYDLRQPDRLNGEARLLDGVFRTDRQAPMLGLNSAYSTVDRVRSERQGRSVTFDSGVGDTPKQKGQDGERPPGSRTSSRVLKVKLNLNPLRRAKVHPGKRAEPRESGSQGKERQERGRGRQGEGEGRHEKTRRRQGRVRAREGERGGEKGTEGERGEKAGGRGSSMKNKRRSGKEKKPANNTDPKEEEEYEEEHAKEDEGEGEEDGRRKQQKHMTPSKQKKTSSSSPPGHGSQESQPENTHDDPSNDPAISYRPGQSHSSMPDVSSAIGPQVLPPQSNLPFSMSASDRNRTVNTLLPPGTGLQRAHSSPALHAGALLRPSAAKPVYSSTLALHSQPRGLASQSSALIPGPPGGLGTQSSALYPGPAGSLASQSSALYPGPLGSLASQSSNLVSGPPARGAAFQTPSLSLTQPPPQSTNQGPSLVPELPQLPAFHDQPVIPPQPQVLQGGEDLPVFAQLSASLGGEAFLPPAPQPPDSLYLESLPSNNNPSAPNLLTPSVSSVPVEGTVTADGHEEGGPIPGPMLQQVYLSDEDGSSSKRKLRLVIPEQSSGRPPTALDRKIR